MSVANDNNIVIYYQDTDSMHLKNADISKLEECYKLKYNTEIRGETMAKFHSDFSLKGAKKGADIIATTSIFLGKKCYGYRVCDCHFACFYCVGACRWNII